MHENSILYFQLTLPLQNDIIFIQDNSIQSKMDQFTCSSYIASIGNILESPKVFPEGLMLHIACCAIVFAPERA